MSAVPNDIYLLASGTNVSQDHTLFQSADTQTQTLREQYFRRLSISNYGSDTKRVGSSFNIDIPAHIVATSLRRIAPDLTVRIDNSRIAQRDFAEKFQKLAAQWRKETSHKSMNQHIAMHPAYQQIIGMGKPVIPLILEDLARLPKHWFWALESITGINPIPESDYGNVQKMAEAWIKWGKDAGYKF